MIHQVIAIKDTNTNTYFAPNYVRSTAGFIRQVSDDINGNTPAHTIADTMAKHPEDFEIHLLGTWDDVTGKTTEQPDPERLARVADLKR